VITAERWAELYRQEFPRVYRALLAVLKDRDEALDALHDAFLQGLRRPPTGDENLGGWLYVVALRRGRKDRLRKRVLARLRPGRAQGDEIKRLLDRLHVASLLAGLSERQRAVVVAQYYLGLDQREIADRLGIKQGTVSATLAQAKARMRSEVRNVS
jgi:RNA polymerase sigma-70 factor, ECF subfamily